MNYSRIGDAVDLVAPGGSKEIGRILSTNRGAVMVEEAAPAKRQPMLPEPLR